MTISLSDGGNTGTGGPQSGSQNGTVTVIGVNNAPALANASTVTYTENDAATPINTLITVSDVDNTTLASATVTLTTFVSGQDVLSFTNVLGTMGNISISSNVGGVLTLTSAGATANLAQWQAALRAVTYANTSDNPTTTARSVAFVVNDGSLASNTITSTINITAVDDAPVQANTSTITYTENGPATPINTLITVNDIDNGTLASATVTITNFVTGQDVLSFTNATGMGNIAVSSNVGGVLTLTSTGATATLTEWQTALRTVTYANASDSPSTTARSVTFVVNDGSLPSNIITSTINITASNDAPALANASTITFTENGAATPINTLITVSDADSVAGQRMITHDLHRGPGRSVVLQRPGDCNITATSNIGGVLTLTSAATATLARGKRPCEP